MNTKREQGGKDILEKIFGKYGIYVALILMVVVLAIITPSFFNTQNFINVLRQISIKAVMAIGVTIVIMTGGIDLSVGSVLALSAVIATSFATSDNPHPLAISLLLGILVGLACGAVNGLCVAWLKVAAFIATLAMTTAARGLAMIYTNGRPVINILPEYTNIGNGFVGAIPIPIIVMAVVIVIAVYLMEFTKYGRYIRAVGGNEQAALVSGINVRLIKFSAYAIAGVTCAIAGILLSARTMTGQPASGEGYELDAIAAAVIGGASLSGGVGTISGTVVGMLILGVLTNGLDMLGVSSYYQQVIKGVIIVAAVLLDRKKHSNE